MRAPRLLPIRIAFAIIGAMPWLLALSPRAAALFWPVFHGLCHQQPERTLILLGAPMVVCSRCAGLFAGLAVGAFAPLGARLFPHGRTLVVASIALATIDVVTQDLGLHPPFHPMRLVTGFLMGWTATAFFFAALLREFEARTLREA
jgi:uncharacterized membrane protein